MIKLDKIKIKVNPNSRMYYNSLGYNCVNYDIIEIHTLDLPPGSNIYIEILCDNCGAESTTKYNKYYKSTNGSSNNNYCKKKYSYFLHTSFLPAVLHSDSCFRQDAR